MFGTLLDLGAWAGTGIALFSCLANAAPTKRNNLTPVMGGANFPDPSVIRMNDGWHAFSTNAHVGSSYIHTQVAFTPDFVTWTLRSGKDAMPQLASWVNAANPKVWAPDVVQVSDGSFVMYYTAALQSNDNIHCLGFATSKSVEGPYVDYNSSPWICPTSQGGAIDPAGYYDPNTGKRWVVYKIDGNAIGHGGSCGNTVAPIVPTPIMLQQVGADGHTLIGAPTQILTNIASDGPYIEAPSVSYLNGRYVLFFSPQCYTTTNYDVSYAEATSITGPYTRGTAPLFATGTEGLVAPGGLDIAVNGNRAVFHGNYGSGRAMYTALLSLNGNTVTAS